MMPDNAEQFAHLKAAADDVAEAANEQRVNALSKSMRQLFEREINADVYCSLAHLIACLAASEGTHYAIPVITILAMEQHARFERRGMH